MALATSLKVFLLREEKMHMRIHSQHFPRPKRVQISHLIISEREVALSLMFLAMC